MIITTTKHGKVFKLLSYYLYNNKKQSLKKVKQIKERKQNNETERTNEWINKQINNSHRSILNKYDESINQNGEKISIKWR